MRERGSEGVGDLKPIETLHKTSLLVVFHIITKREFYVGLACIVLLRVLVTSGFPSSNEALMKGQKGPLLNLFEMSFKSYSRF